MTVGYEVSLRKGEKWILTRVLPNGEEYTKTIDPGEITALQEMSSNFQWNERAAVAREIGEKLYRILGNELDTALAEASAHGENLHLYIQSDADLPFELLYSSGYIVPSRIHLVRKVSDYGSMKSCISRKRPLKILFMACSPLDVTPVLEFEKEEEAIFEITRNLPVDIDVEDTGSLQGLKDRLDYTEYDVIHMTGHATIDEKGPYFCMEDEEGYLDRVRPSELWKTLKSGTALPQFIFLSGCRT